MRPVHVAKASINEECYVVEGASLSSRPWVAFANSDLLLKLYDSVSGTHVGTIQGHTAAISDITTTQQAGLSDLLITSQRDTGIMISDIRAQAGAGTRYLTELMDSGCECFSVSAHPLKPELAVAVGNDIHIVDMRTWATSSVLPVVHGDDVTRVRWCGQVLCTAAEDQLVNFLDPTQNEDDLVVSVININECVNRMSYFPQFNVVTLTGSLENAYVCPLDFTAELRLPRPSCDAFQVDFVAVGGRLQLVQGTHTEESFYNLRVMDAQSSTESWSLNAVHTDVARVSIGIDQSTMITAGEDGKVVWWSVDPSRQPVFNPLAVCTKAPRPKNSPEALRHAGKPY